MDFTVKKYSELLQTFQSKGYEFITFEEYCEGKRAEKFVVLRHDVDLKCGNSLTTAKIENGLGIRGTYYFRTLSESNIPTMIKDIVSLSHEIGYHYEDMSLCGADPDRAVEHFYRWLAYFREYYPVKTVCMHGAPTSKYDSKDIWQFADYRSMGIIGEPYFDADFSELFYITDTGRCWDGYKVSVRDKIPKCQDEWIAKGLVYHSTSDIIEAIQKGLFPNKLMMTTHPQRWSDNWLFNSKEYIIQKVKNIIKWILINIKQRKL
ncbi:MAG: hypothetical protein R3Y15_01385 [Rikenellaceae bacterium]